MVLFCRNPEKPGKSFNLHFSKWTNLFLDKTMTTALLDRVTHSATIIKYDWDSIRLNETIEDKKEAEIEY